MVKERALERPEEAFMVIVDASDWRVIPVENFLAAFGQLGNVELVMRCGDGEEAMLMRDVMEVGVDGVLADVDGDVDGGVDGGVGLVVKDACENHGGARIRRSSTLSEA